MKEHGSWRREYFLQNQLQISIIIELGYVRILTECSAMNFFIEDQLLCFANLLNYD